MRRKPRLHTMVPKRGEPMLYFDHIAADGETLFHLACESDLEGIVPKCKSGPYPAGTWNMQAGSRFAVRNIRSGSVARSYSSSNVKMILIFKSGMGVLWRAQRSDN